MEKQFEGIVKNDKERYVPTTVDLILSDVISHDLSKYRGIDCVVMNCVLETFPMESVEHALPSSVFGDIRPN